MIRNADVQSRFDFVCIEGSVAMYGELCHIPMCLLAAVGLLAPRLILILMWLFNSAFMLQPFEGLGVPNPVIPIAGLFFLPTTTLGFCWATLSFGGVSSFSEMLIIAIGVIIDLGLLGNGRGITKR